VRPVLPQQRRSTVPARPGTARTGAARFVPAARSATATPSARSLLAEATRDHHRAIERQADAAAAVETVDGELVRALEQVDVARSALRRARRGLALTVEIHALVVGDRDAARGVADAADAAVTDALHARDAAHRGSFARRRAAAAARAARVRAAAARAALDRSEVSVVGSIDDLAAARRARDAAHRHLVAVLPVLSRARARLVAARAAVAATRGEERDAVDRVTAATQAMVRAGAGARR